MSHISKMLSRQWKVLLVAGLLVSLLMVGIGLISPLEYRADAELLILTRQQSGTDPLTVARAQEQIAGQLAENVEKDLFYNQVIADNTLPSEVVERFTSIEDDRKRRKAWNKAVEARANVGTSLLTLTAYDTNAEHAEQLASQMAQTLIQNGTEYVGTLVVGRVVNEPIATDWPVRPNIFLHALFGFIIGIMGMGWLLIKRSKPNLF